MSDQDDIVTPPFGHRLLDVNKEDVHLRLAQECVAVAREQSASADRLLRVAQDSLRQTALRCDTHDTEIAELKKIVADQQKRIEDIEAELRNP